jgi:ferredoxin
MRIVVDQTRSTSLGICQSIASDVSEVDDDGELVVLADEVPEGVRDLVE